MKISKKLVFSAAILFSVLAMPWAVLAAGNSASAYVSADQIIDGNYIKAGNVIDIAGSVNGDVIVAGNSITISGPVAGDVIAAGNTIKIKGPVSGNIRVIANSLEIENTVERNVWFLASNVTLGDQSKIGWDVYGAAGTLVVKAQVGGNITASVGVLTIGNEVGKNVEVYLDQSGQVVLLPEASVKGNLTYHAAADNQLEKPEGAQVAGQIKRQAISQTQAHSWKGSAGSYLLFAIISFFSLLVIGLVLVTLMPKLVFQVEAEMRAKPWANLGKGLIFAIVVPIAAIILMVTIIGLPLGLIVLPLYLIALYLAKVFGAFAIGLFLTNYFSRSKKYSGALIWPMALGLAVVVLVTSIPMIGWLAKIVLILWTLGAMVTVKKEIWREFK